MAILTDQPLLADYQKFILESCKERGWDKHTPIEKMMLLTEEVGELAKAIRKESGAFGYAKPDNTTHLAEELVDVLNYVLDLANDFDVNLEEAFRAKWKKTATRTWEVPD